jgi:hypothetical protein
MLFIEGHLRLDRGYELIVGDLGRHLRAQADPGWLEIDQSSQRIDQNCFCRGQFLSPLPAGGHSL